MKVTISDIAEAANVSSATVDRVLNNRVGVSAVNRQRVLNAARSVGYLPEEDGVAMPSKPAELEFFIPVGTNMFLEDLANAIEEFASRLPLVSSCIVHRISDFSPKSLFETVENLQLGTSGVGVIALDHPRNRELLRNLVEVGLRVVTIASDIPSVSRANFIGIDNRIAGRTAALLMGRLINPVHSHVAVFLGSNSYRGHEEREAGFRAVLTKDYSDLTLLGSIEIKDSSQTGYLKARELLESNPKIGGIYCIGGGRSGVVRAVDEVNPKIRPVLICHDLTNDSRNQLLDGKIDILIDQNAQLMAEQSVINLLGTLATTAPYLTHKLIEPRIIFRENIPMR
ncbi:MAG: LacI family DNA-binding transcriptional regulator [Rhizobiales bacterium]|nr:LacI family DNA-binding transcriptional regulator [Hyphomicrobiales bacterium]NRB15826.1 LacI family DNA-binding transcriptional regulator [Hyphomicrobiales bacterium]